MTKSVALVTAEEARALDEDLPPLARALDAAGIAHEIVCWDEDVDWSRFAAAVLRSTWDYVPRLDEFLDWAARVSAQTRLLNPLPLIRWNTDKHYLADLGAAGIAIVPSTFVQPGSAAQPSLDAFLAGGAFTEFVVKPCVGAGSRDAARYHRDDRALALAHLERLLADDRAVVMQPYLDRVDSAGETALIHIDGAYSHAIRKGPLLRRAESPTSALFAPEEIAARTPDAAERELAAQAVAAVSARFAAFAPLLYLRVDLLRLPDGRPCVLELETTEPSLFFDHAPGSAARFVEALRRRLAAA